MKSLDFGRYALGDFAAAAPFGRVRRIAAADQRAGRYAANAGDCVCSERGASPFSVLSKVIPFSPPIRRNAACCGTA